VLGLGSVCVCVGRGEKKPVDGNFGAFLYHKNKKKKLEPHEIEIHSFFFIFFVKGNRVKEKEEKLFF
jgi:hypothetical protein